MKFFINKFPKEENIFKCFQYFKSLYDNHLKYHIN